MNKLSNAEAELKKSVAYKKMRVLQKLYSMEIKLVLMLRQLMTVTF